jgi:putative phage-type endonuclease
MLAPIKNAHRPLTRFEELERRLDRKRRRRQQLIELTERKGAQFLQQGSQEWHKARKNRLTASNFGTVCGLSKWVTPKSFWCLSTGRVTEDERTELAVTATAWGNRMEGRVRQAYVRVMEDILMSCLHVTESGLHIHPSHCWLGASPDGLVEGGLLEIKCPIRNTLPQNTSGAAAALAVPPQYMAQMQGQMEIIDRSYCDYICFCRKDIENSSNVQDSTVLEHVEGEMIVVRVSRSGDYWGWMYSRLERFWVAVQSDVQPADDELPCPCPPPGPPAVHCTQLFRGILRV